MQNTLTFTADKIKYVSKPFDFEAMCIIDDARYDGEKKGPLSLCRNAVDYMFEGTDATQDVINNMKVSTRARLCNNVWGMYIEAITEKNE